MSKTATKPEKKTDEELPNMPKKGPLREMAEEIIELKGEITNLNAQIISKEEALSEAMEQENVEFFRVPHPKNGMYAFRIENKGKVLKVSKEKKIATT